MSASLGAGAGPRVDVVFEDGHYERAFRLGSLPRGVQLREGALCSARAARAVLSRGPFLEALRARELRAVLETCTGCVPSGAECRAMLRGRKTVDVDAFLAIYRDVQAGALDFASLAQTMAAFDDLCSAIPDA